MRTVDIHTRKREVLLALVKEFIDTAQPVSSEGLKEKYGFSLSSATLRHVLSELEDDGYLLQPHTSAGRVPSDKGYRYYLEFLMKAQELLSVQAHQALQNMYKKALNDLEHIVEKSSDIIAELTHYAGLASLEENNDRFFLHGIHFLLDQPEFYDVEKLRQFLKALEARSNLLEVFGRARGEGVAVFVGKESKCDGMEDCSLIVKGYARKGRPMGHLGVLGPKRMDYSKVIGILETITTNLNELLDEIEI